MLACLVHVRLTRSDQALKGASVRTVEDFRTASDPANELLVAWNRILDHDFKPVFSLGRDILTHLTRTVRKTEALNAALRRIAKRCRGSCRHLCVHGYGTMRANLFNRVMGHQAADGAYFTRPVAATLLAELCVDSVEAVDWTTEEAWKNARAFDPACGSGSLLHSYIRAIKRRMERRARATNSCGCTIAMRLRTEYVGWTSTLCRSSSPEHSSS